MKKLETKFAKEYSTLLSENNQITGIVADLKSKNGLEYQIGIAENIDSFIEYSKDTKFVRPATFAFTEFPIIYVGLRPKEFSGFKPKHPEYSKLKDILTNKKNNLENSIKEYITNPKLSMGKNELITSRLDQNGGNGGPCLIGSLNKTPRETIELLPFKIQLLEQMRQSIDSEISHLYYEVIF